MLLIHVHNDRQDEKLEHPGGVLELGRGPDRPGVPRCFVDDTGVSRDQLLLRECPGGKVEVENLSQRVLVNLADQPTLAPGEKRELPLPVHLTVSATTIKVQLKPAALPRPAPLSIQRTFIPNAAPPEDLLRVSPEPPLSRAELSSQGILTIAAPVKPAGRAQVLELPGVRLGDSPSAELLAQWIETILAFQRSGGSAEEFYDQAAKALVSMIGLDVGLVLLHQGAAWKVVARASTEEENERAGSRGREFSQTVLNQVLADRRTFFQDLGQMRSQESLMSIDAVVASPVFRAGDEIAGVLYGLRRRRGPMEATRVTPLEAQLVQVLAAAVGANLARAEATRTRVQFEQFFSPALVRELERDPGLLDGRRHEVTILMSDLRGFSRLSEKLGPEDTCRFVRDVMEFQSHCIVEQGGAIVSYLGDGILAMWNAPVGQDDHAILACRAALAIQKGVPALTAAWLDRLGAPVSIGVGVNTGPAQVGNTGSTRKFMYGPLGNTVNLASRVEGATKYLHTPILVTGATRSELGSAFATRRICKVRVVGIAEPVDLHELHGETADPVWSSRRDTYESGLSQYESKQWFKACQTLLPLLEEAESTGKYDHAALKLMKRCWSCLESPPEVFEPVLELAAK